MAAQGKFMAHGSGGLILSPPIFRGSTIGVSSQRKSVVHFGNAFKTGANEQAAARSKFPAVSLRASGVYARKQMKPWRINSMQGAHPDSLRFPCSFPHHWPIACVHAGLTCEKFSAGIISLLASLKQESSPAWVPYESPVRCTESGHLIEL